MSYELIKQQIQQRKFSPVYYLHGEETYFIDKLAEMLDELVVSPDEATFNKTIFYGGESNANKVLTECRGFPVMANTRLVLVREAQSLAKKEIEKFTEYLKKPVKSTVLVLCFKGKEAKLPKAAETGLAAAGGIDFLAKKMYDKDIKIFVNTLIQQSGIEADAGIAETLVDSLGTNLHFIENELNKMLIYLQATQQPRLTRAILLDSINVDKEFNSFELVAALCAKDSLRAQMIAERLTQNVKLNPPIVTISALFRLFNQLATVHSQRLVDVKSIQEGLGINYYAAQDYANARKHYTLGITYRNLTYIQEADLMLKGVQPTFMEDRHIVKTLVWRLLN